MFLELYVPLPTHFCCIFKKEFSKIFDNSFRLLTYPNQNKQNFRPSPTSLQHYMFKRGLSALSIFWIP